MWTNGSYDFHSFRWSVLKDCPCCVRKNATGVKIICNSRAIPPWLQTVFRNSSKKNLGSTNPWNSELSIPRGKNIWSTTGRSTVLAKKLYEFGMILYGSLDPPLAQSRYVSAWCRCCCAAGASAQGHYDSISSCVFPSPTCIMRHKADSCGFNSRYAGKNDIVKEFVWEWTNYPESL